MIKFLSVAFFVVSFFVNTISFSQTAIYSNDISLVKEINVEQYVGKKFSYTAQLRTVPADSLATSQIFMLQVGKDDYDFFRETGGYAINKNDSGWHTLSLSGIIKPGAKRIWLYIIAKGNGSFYFDNISFIIESKNNESVSSQIFNIDFEEKPNVSEVVKSFKNNKSLLKNPNAKASIEYEGGENGTVLLVSCKNNKITYTTEYGNNKKAANFITLKDGKKLYYETYGQGEPLLLLHGNGGSIYSFKKQIPDFAKYYKVIAVDTRGQGNSVDDDTENFTYNLFASDIEQLAQQLNLTSVNIVGWSDGGNTGLILAKNNPGLVNKLVVMGANLNPSDTSITKKIINRVSNDITKLKKQNDHKNVVTIRLLEMLLKEPNIPAYELNKVTAKTLVMAGENDLILERHTRLIAQNIPNAQLNIVKNATHFLPEQKPDVFNKIVLAFLKGN